MKNKKKAPKLIMKRNGRETVITGDWVFADSDGTVMCDYKAGEFRMFSRLFTRITRS